MSLVPAGDPAEVFAATLRTDMPMGQGHPEREYRDRLRRVRTRSASRAGVGRRVVDQEDGDIAVSFQVHAARHSTFTSAPFTSWPHLRDSCSMNVLKSCRLLSA